MRTTKWIDTRCKSCGKLFRFRFERGGDNDTMLCPRCVYWQNRSPLERIERLLKYMDEKKI